MGLKTKSQKNWLTVKESFREGNLLRMPNGHKQLLSHMTKIIG